MSDHKQTDQDFLNDLLGKPIKTEETVETKVEAEVIADVVEQKVVEAEVKTDVIDYDKLVLERLGYNTFNDFINSDAPNKLKQYENVVGEVTKYKQENDELINEFGTVSKPFVNDKVAKLNRLLSDNPDLTFETASAILGSNVGTMNAVDKILLAEKIRNPELNEALIRRSLVKKFGVDSMDDLYKSDLDEDTRADIEIEAVKAGKELKKFDIEYTADDKYLPEKVKERVNERLNSKKVAVEEVEREWLPTMQYIEQNFKEFDIPTMDKDGKIVNYTKLVLKPEQVKKYTNRLMELAKQNEIKTANEESQKFMAVSLQNMVLTDNIAMITKLAADKAANEEFQRYKRERDGFVEKTDKPDSGGQKKDILTHLEENVKQTNYRDVRW